MNRRLCLQGLALSCLAPALARAQPADAGAALDALRRGGGGLVVAMRHALAPGTFDPPGFQPGVCSTQRNLSDEGREQARRVGAWYRERGLVPTAVRSSEWCRCLDTARLAFGAAEPWPALNSIVRERSTATAQTQRLRDELARRALADVRGFEVWVTHQVNISALAGSSTGSGEAWLLRHDPARAELVVVGPLSVA
ncbi:MAG TPA: histidine phosphatase family protein [Caldimonas sp.]|jgi:phosphohistidine phosphatase SixA|nr:histidine phosphatase family protein [Caldimonas sp.]HEX2539939.1 histidine phosphatase family protein [Caldimonas sp.]